MSRVTVNRAFKTRNGLIFVAVFAVISTSILLISRAATAPTAFEPETGALAAGATSVSNANASGGKVLAFAGAAPTPTPAPTATTLPGVISTLDVLGGYGTEIETPGIAPVVSPDGTLITAGGNGPGKWRSEIVYTNSAPANNFNTYPSTLPSNSRFVAGQKLRFAFDVKTTGFDRLSGVSWYTVMQTLGRTPTGGFPVTPFSINILPGANGGTWDLQGGSNALPGPGTPNEWTPAPAHHDETWYRWEIEDYLGGPGVGYVSVWLNGQLITTGAGSTNGRWYLPHGTFYAGNNNANIDLQWLYVKNGLYGFASGVPVNPRNQFRNRFITITNANGSAVTWKGP